MSLNAKQQILKVDMITIIMVHVSAHHSAAPVYDNMEKMKLQLNKCFPVGLIL